MNTFRLEAKGSDEVFVLCPTQDLDLASANAFADAMSTVLAEPGASCIVVDLSSVSFVDSSGLRVLVEGAELAQDSGTDFVLKHPAAQLSRMIELTGTGGILADSR